MNYRELLDKAKEVSQNAYVPYSKFKVGACVLTEDDNAFCGCNFENASYGLTICAERNAIGTAIANGHTRIKAIAIYSPNEDNCFPCGACRQVMTEFRAGGDMDIVTEVKGEPQIYKLSYLMPESFKL